jgi:hypothetical protein
LKTNDNSESEDDFDPETGEINDEIASPEVLVCSEDRCPQHIHGLHTGPVVGMKERPDGLAAQPSTGTKE